MRYHLVQHLAVALWITIRNGVGGITECNRSHCGINLLSVDGRFLDVVGKPEIVVALNK